MARTPYESYSTLFLFLAQFFEENQKRSPGRPRSKEETDEDDSRDDVEMYQNPDPHTTSPYSYNDLKAWYEADPANRGTMPARGDLVIHKSYRGQRD